MKCPAFSLHNTCHVLQCNLLLSLKRNTALAAGEKAGLGNAGGTDLDVSIWYLSPETEPRDMMSDWVNIDAFLYDYYTSPVEHRNTLINV